MKLATPCRPHAYGLWLDDVHAPPSSDWQWAKTSRECISAILARTFAVVSLDHDLGGQDTGAAVLAWLERTHHDPVEPDVRPREVRLHTANPVGRGMMAAQLLSIGYTARPPMVWTMPAGDLRTVYPFVL